MMTAVEIQHALIHVMADGNGDGMELRLTRAIALAIREGLEPLQMQLAGLAVRQQEFALYQEKQNASFADRERVSEMARNFADKQRLEDVANHVHDLANRATVAQTKTDLRLQQVADRVKEVGDFMRQISTDISGLSRAIDQVSHGAVEQTRRIDELCGELKELQDLADRTRPMLKELEENRTDRREMSKGTRVALYSVFAAASIGTVIVPALMRFFGH